MAYTSKIKPVYEEKEDAGNVYRENYLNGLDKLIESRRREAAGSRHAFGKTISADREQAREEYIKMLGWPLGTDSPVISAKEIPVFENDKYIVTRIVLELFPGLPFYGILFRHVGAKERPLVISQHGGQGTPEICSSFFRSANYNDMSMRIFLRGVNVFAPQTLLWESPKYGPENRRDEIDNSLKQLGSSIAALEIYAIMKSIDYLTAQGYAGKSIGMAGLSYGGFYTLYTAAADTRIRACLAVSHFNDRTKHNWHSKVWFGSALRFLDPEVGALVCPRFLRIETGSDDNVFLAEDACREFEVLKDYYSEAADQLEFNVFEGVHEFCPEDTGIEHLIAHLSMEKEE